MGFIAEAKRKNLWFGTEEKMEWFKTPSRGADTSPAGWDSEGTTLNGGGYVFNSFGSHKQYQFDWGSSNARVVAQKMKSYSDGSYGRGYIYFVDPTIYDHNVLPAHWADPSMGIDYEGNSIVAGVEPTGVPTGANSNDLPVQAAQFNLNTTPVGFRGKAQAVYVPIPEGHTLSLGAMYSFTGSGGVFASPVLLTGAIAAPQKLTTLGVNTPNIVTDTFSGVRGVWLWVGKSAAGNSTVTIHGLIGRLMTNAEATSYVIAENLFTNPNLVGDGTFAEVGRNLFTNPRLVGDGTWAEVRRNRCLNPGIVTNHYYGANRCTATASDGVLTATVIEVGYIPRVAAGTAAIPIATGSTISLSVDTVEESLPLVFRVQFFSDVGGTVVLGIPAETIMPTSGRVGYTATAPAGAASVRLEIGCESNTPIGGVFKFARVLVEVNGTSYAFFDGSTMDDTMPQPEDFRVRWLGTPNASESVMEGERVRGAAGFGAVGIVSSSGLRVIRTALGNSYVHVRTTQAPTTTTGRVALVSRVGAGTLTPPSMFDVSLNLNNFPLLLDSATNIYKASADTSTWGAERRLVLRAGHSSTFAAIGDEATYKLPSIFAGDYRYPWNGSPDDLSGITQPEDFRTRWTGAEDNSELVLEIERVRGLTAVGCIAGVSSRDGKPAARLIPTANNADSFAQFIIPSGAARLGGTALGTSSSDAPLTSPVNPNGYALGIRTITPNRYTGRPNDAVPRQIRHMYDALSADYGLRWYHGGTLGSGDVWWTEIGLFAGSYDGPAFSGSSPQNGTTHYRWTGTPDNSTSEAYYVSSKSVEQRRGPWVGGMGHSGCRFVGKPTFIENGPDWTGFSATFKEVVN